MVEASIDWLNSNVCSMVIATHDRTIEGKIIELLIGHGWDLRREKPCKVEWHRPGPLLSRTILDGTQYWINPKLGSRSNRTISMAPLRQSVQQLKRNLSSLVGRRS